MFQKEIIFLFLLLESSVALGYSRNLIDEKFKLGRQAEGKPLVKTEIEKIYKDVFAKSMYSKCQWLPSDSQYLKIKTTQCGQARGSFLAVGRFLAEADAALISEHAVNDQGRLRFVNLRDFVRNRPPPSPYPGDGKGTGRRSGQGCLYYFA